MAYNAAGLTPPNSGPASSAPVIHEVEMLAKLHADGEKLRDQLRAVAQHVRAENEHMQAALEQHAEAIAQRDNGIREVVR